MPRTKARQYRRPEQVNIPVTLLAEAIAEVGDMLASHGQGCKCAACGIYDLVSDGLIEGFKRHLPKRIRQVAGGVKCDVSDLAA